MNEGELQRQLVAGSHWWRRPQGWEAEDPDLRRLRDAPIDYEPSPLEDVTPDGLYMLRGPRRVGKSVEVKRAIGALIRRNVDPRQIIHFSCDGLRSADLRRLHRVARDQLTRPITEPRYWFLDEITAVPGWPAEIKWLRDNTDMGVDCVVLTGSSARDLEDARKELAGRRGAAVDSDRLLMPMSFRAFCHVMGMRDLPKPDPVEPRDLLSPAIDHAVAELLPWLDDLVSLWAVYCRVGGFPRAAADQVAHGDVASDFSVALWDVVHGGALQTEDFSAAQSLQLLVRLAKNLASPINMTSVAEDIGVGHHQTAQRRVKSLVDAYLAWPCHKRGDHNLPQLSAQPKVYFSDPLIARLASIRAEQVVEPDPSQLSEQQIGMALVLAIADGDPARYADFSSVMYARSSGGKEVDFCGRPLGAVAVEGKYVDDKLARETQTMRALFGGRGVLATRSKLETVGEVRAFQAGFIAYLLRA